MWRRKRNRKREKAWINGMLLCRITNKTSISYQRHIIPKQSHRRRMKDLQPLKLTEFLIWRDFVALCRRFSPLPPIYLNKQHALASSSLHHYSLPPPISPINSQFSNNSAAWTIMRWDKHTILVVSLLFVCCVSFLRSLTLRTFSTHSSFASAHTERHIDARTGSTLFCDVKGRTRNFAKRLRWDIFEGFLSCHTRAVCVLFAFDFFSPFSDERRKKTKSRT